MAYKKCFLICAEDDKDLALEIENTLFTEEGLKLLKSIDNESVDSSMACVDGLNLIFVLATDNSRKCTSCNTLVKYAHDLNKNIVVLSAVSGFFSGVSWVKKEWQIDTDPYNWPDFNVRAELMAQVREWMGKTLLEGDRVGAHVKFVNNTDEQKYGSATFVLKKNDDAETIIETKIKEVPIEIRLQQGCYTYCFSSSHFPNRVRQEEKFEIKHNSQHREFSADLGTLTEKYKEYAKECRTVASECKSKLSQLIPELKDNIKNWDNKIYKIQSSRKEWSWYNKMTLILSSVFSAILALFYVMAPYCYDNQFGDQMQYASAAITTLGMPIILFFNYPFCSYVIIITLAVIYGLMYFFSRRVEKESILGLIVGVKLIDCCLSGFYVYGHRRLVVGVFIGFVLVHFIYWLIQIVPFVFNKCLVGYRLDYCKYRKQPFENNYDYLNSISEELSGVTSLSMETLEVTDNDRVVLSNVQVPLQEYIKKPKYGKSFSLFPIKRLLIGVVSILLILVGLYKGLDILLVSYHNYVEGLLNFNIDLL